MFGIGSTELLVILVVALIVLGPKSLASFSRSLGKMMGEFRRVSTDFQRTLNYEAAQQEMQQKRSESSVTGTGSGEKTANQGETTFASYSPDSPVGQAVMKARQEAQGGETEPTTASDAPGQDKTGSKGQ